MSTDDRAAHTPPSEHQHRADHYQYFYEQASEGKCGHSGLTIGACKASICDCFEFPWVAPAPEEHPDPAPPARTVSGPNERECCCHSDHGGDRMRQWRARAEAAESALAAVQALAETCECLSNKPSAEQVRYCGCDIAEALATTTTPEETQP